MSTASFQADAKVHLLAIRKALANRNAAVMVGAGFSRNAEGGHNLATWSQLSDALANELEPERKPGTFTPATASQLAEQYARVFSPTHLEQLIKRCIPDDQVMPGQLHTQLLELPWSEVFTTNYDTLLEPGPPHSECIADKRHKWMFAPAANLLFTIRLCPSPT